MNRILVVVFGEASKAFEARDALKGFDHEDILTLYAHAIITKNPDGTCTVNEEQDRAALKTVLGSSIGALIGLLGGPAGFAFGAAAGFLTGVTAYLDTARVSATFVDEVSRELTPGKFALVAEIDEDWTRWIDLRMEELGGVIYRYAPSEVKHAAHKEEIAALKAELAQLRAEHAEASADRQAKLYETINQLETRIEQQMEKAKQRRREQQRQAKAKAEILDAKAERLKAKAATTAAKAGGSR